MLFVWVLADSYTLYQQMLYLFVDLSLFWGTVNLGLLHLVAAVGSTAHQAGPTSGRSCSRSTQVSQCQNVQCRN